MIMQVTLRSVLLHHQQHTSTVAARKKRESWRYIKVDFTFFFIWQAIVRGQLFLQWTFFLLWNRLNA